MEQRKQFTQSEFEQMRQLDDNDVMYFARWPGWLYDLLSTYGEVHEHEGSVVHSFSKVMTVWGYQPQNLISWGKSCRTVSGRIFWMLKTKSFPGPNVQKATGDEFYQFFHMTSVQGLLGIMKTGMILPSATDRMRHHCAHSSRC